MKAVASLLFILVSSVAFGDTPISTPPIGPTPLSNRSSRIVTLGDGFLAVWWELDQPAGLANLKGSRLDREGHPGSPLRLLSTNINDQLDLLNAASDGNSAFILVGRYTVLMLLRVDTDGTVTTLSNALPLAPRDYGGSMAATGGYVLFFAAPADRPRAVTLFDRDGVLVRGDVPVAESGGLNESLSAAGGGGTFLLSWADQGDNKVRVKSVLASDIAANNVSVSRYVPGSVGSGVGRLSLAVGGTRAVAAWLESSDSNGGPLTTLRTRALGSNGVPYGDAPATIGSFLLAAGPAVSVASDGYDVVVKQLLPASQSYRCEIVAAHLSNDGVVQSISHTPAGLDTGSANQVALASNGTQSFATWLEDDYFQSSVPEVMAAPLSANGLGAKVTLSLDAPEEHVRKLLAPAPGLVAGLWTESAPNERLVVGRFSSDGQALDGPGLRLRDSLYNQNGSAMASDGNELFVVWVEGGEFQPGSVYAATVAIEGTLVANVRQLATDAGDANLSVLWNGSVFVIVYQQFTSKAIVAIRADRDGNVIDPQPVPLTSVHSPYFADSDPRLSLNGAEYLLVWHRDYYYGVIPELSGTPTDVAAQRYTAGLTADGPEIVLSGRAGDPSGPTIAWDVSVSGGLWLVTWGVAYYSPFQGTAGPDSPDAVYTRIDLTGHLLDPIGGQPLRRSFGGFLSSPVAGGWETISMGGSSNSSPSAGRIGLDGATSSFGIIPGDAASVESFAMVPTPLITYKRAGGDPLAYIGALPQHRRAGGH